jgi:hypothetical protein
MRRSAWLLPLGAAAALAARGWAGRTPATPQEARAPLPGDDLVEVPLWSATRAITIDAPAGRVWPWIVQMGFPTRRAGWYTPAWLDRVLFGITARSADRIVPELQSLAIGDRIPDSDDGSSFFTVARLEPQQALVLLSHTHPLPLYRDVSFSWAFVLRERGGRTRLTMRARAAYRPIGPPRLIRLVVSAMFTPGDVVQAGAMLIGIRRRVESTGAATA